MTNLTVSPSLLQIPQGDTRLRNHVAVKRWEQWLEQRRETEHSFRRQLKSMSFVRARLPQTLFA